MPDVATKLDDLIAARHLRLFSDHGKRDLAAADKAFARIRARYGHDSVVRAMLTEGHLPEVQGDSKGVPLRKNRER